jgi:hypothetical protein
VPTTKTKKLEATVDTVKAAAGPTWFHCSDEGDHIELSTRDHGDVGSETAGKADKVEGRRLFKLVTKVFRPSAWEVTYDVIDEWVSVSVRTLPLTKAEKDKARIEKKITDLRHRIQDACKAANAAITKPNVRQTFVGSVYDGHGYFLAYVRVDYGTRILYRAHLGAELAFATLQDAEAAVQPILAQFQDVDWTRKVMEPRPRHTGNYRPPNNVIENVGAIKFEARIPAI